MKQKDIERRYQITGNAFECVFKAMGFEQFRKSYSSDHLVWAAGENWKNLNSDYDYEIIRLEI